MQPIYTAPAPTGCYNHNNNSDSTCECMRAAELQARKDKRDRAVTAVTKALHKHRIPYRHSGIPHVVVVAAAGVPDLYLSLKSVTDGMGYTTYKYRFANTDEWLIKRRDTFFSWIKSLVQPESGATATLITTMPFGKFRGRALTELAQEELSYLRWVFENANAASDDLRKTLALLLDSK